MHILVIPSWYYTEENALLGSFFREQAAALSEHPNIKVSLAYVDLKSLRQFNRILKPEMITVQDEYGFIEYRYTACNLIPRSKLAYNRLIYYYLNKLVKDILDKEGKIDVIHLQSFVTHGFAANRLSKKLNIPLVYTEHSTLFSRGLVSKFDEKIIRDIAINSKAVTCVGSGLRKELYNIAGKIPLITPNFVDESVFIRKSEKKRKIFSILSVGFLTEKKGFKVLIEAFHRFHRRFPNSELVIGGDGPQRSELELIVSSFNLTGVVHFKGAQSRTQIADLMKRASVFALASEHETFGVVLIEALACGTPIVTTNCEGPSDLVNNTNGLVVEINDIDGLCCALEQVYSNESYYDEVSISNDCIETYGKKAYIERMLNIFKNGSL